VPQNPTCLSLAFVQGSSTRFVGCILSDHFFFSKRLYPFGDFVTK
jgi:hypothetical protein